MPEFDRAAAILAELAGMDDDSIAQTAEIAFRTQNDHESCRILRESIAEEYRGDKVDPDDLWRTASEVGDDVAKRGNQFARFAAVHDIGGLQVINADEGCDPSLGCVPVGSDDSIDHIVEAALRVRFTQAAHTLLTYLEADADNKEIGHFADDVTDSDDSDVDTDD